MPNDPNNVRSHMNGMASMLDYGVNRTVNALKRNGLWNNTLLVFAAGAAMFQTLSCRG